MVYPPEELIVNQPQQSDRDLSPLCQQSKVAPHHLTPSVTSVLPEQRQIRTLEWEDPPSHCHVPPTCHQTAISTCIPVPDTFL